jgi:transcriptional regulator with XRE-family HTH domain
MTNLLTIEQIEQHLANRNLTKLSYKTEISRQTLSSIANGTNKNPSYEVLKKLSEYLTNNQVGSELLGGK